jgi:succinate-semialdehyde dehydrogenase / glutarate-semialdehyde dehydrogenase
MAIASINPVNGRILRTFAPLTDAELERKLALAEATARTYPKCSLSQRSVWLHKAARILEDEKAALGRMMTEEMGKTHVSAIAEAEKCAWGCRYYADQAPAQLADERVETAASRSYVRYSPIGPVLAIMPWNFPFWQVFRFAAPALMAGNVGLLKHASNVPLCALAIEDILSRAGFPEGAFQTLLLESGRVEGLLRDNRVKAATLTGSEAAGASVGSIAGHEIKKTVLELGGSDPFVVLPSADLPAAIATAAKARNINNGQSCIAAKRFIVHADVYEQFERGFVAAMAAAKVGDPMEASTDIGPLATEKIREEIHEQVERAKSEGARVLTGGKCVEGAGWFYEPTVLAQVKRGSSIFYEEIFGPVAMIFRVGSAEEALELANDSKFGLAASIWTQDAGEQEMFAAGIETGSVFFNASVASDPRLPFGGIKKSGYGRELSAFGIREFVNIKTVWMK